VGAGESSRRDEQGHDRRSTPERAAQTRVRPRRRARRCCWPALERRARFRTRAGSTLDVPGAAVDDEAVRRLRLGRETNKRYRFLSIRARPASASPRPADPDGPRPRFGDRVRRGRQVGVSIASVEDMADLFEGIPLERVSTSMTINATAAIPARPLTSPSRVVTAWRPSDCPAPSRTTS